MAEQDLQQPEFETDDSGTVGMRLRRAREAMHLSRADIAARTKIAERHLAAIEEERYADLASSTYAVGFSRAYARAVGLDERAIAQSVRDEIDTSDEVVAPAKQTFEPGDPARIPSLRTAWVAGIAALAVVAGVALYWGSYIFPAVSLPDLIKDTPPAKVAEKKAAPAAAAPAVPGAQGPVTITAREAGVWVKITDGSKRLFEKQMALGERFTVPADAVEPKLRTGWPDALAVTIGGHPVAPLADKRIVTTVPISAAALLARGQPAPVAAPQTVPAPTAPPPVVAVPAAAPAAQPARQTAPAAAPQPRATRTPEAAPTPRPSAAARPTNTPTPTVRPSASAPRPAATQAPAPAPSPAAPAAAPAEQPKASPVSP